MDDKEYFELDHVSYSLLSTIADDPLKVIQPEQISSSALNVGSALDCMMYEPNKFDELFLVGDKPSDAIATIVEQYYALTGKLLDQDDDTLLKVIENNNYYNNWKAETKLKNVKKDGEIYCMLLSSSEDKTILSTSQHQTVLNMKSALLASDFTRDDFVEPSFGTERYTQFVIIWEYNGLKCKSKLDDLVIDHKNKMLRPKDLKSTGACVREFPKSFYKWKYYIQAAFYTKALEYWAKSNSLGDYTIAPFEFIVVGKRCDHQPLKFSVTENDLKVGEFGGITKWGTEIKGFSQLLEQYKWHKENSKWNVTPDELENSGKLTLDIFENA